MIDMETYRKLHADANSLEHTDRKSQRLSADELAQAEPPDERFCFLLPEKTKGYNLRRKKWYEISLDRISDVEWNREAFHSLVIERSAKDMIQALVTNQIETEKSTDLIAGKGNGLILLLHGGPGTGKTLTAESVAEIAQKPLYRVTCGDVGTKAEDVERYLESVLYLGRIWGCVVLLDEADIFLEQRSLEDLERNALVSVFLRVLEYYDGILILTSNRVGTFDEAFRSRIQLALHYPSLGPQQRFRIWQTFVDRLDSMGEDIDIADLRDNLHTLKEERLNGRQIRNVITTARQYAKWKGTTLTYEHLKEVIRVSGRFDDYLDKLNGGFSPDQIAQDDGVR
jgi:SpoVK/Ycf46/Vps4 family AAA+-type ATPase